MDKYANTVACDHTCWWFDARSSLFALHWPLAYVCLVVGRILLVSRCKTFSAATTTTTTAATTATSWQQQQSIQPYYRSVIDPWTLEQKSTKINYTQDYEISIRVVFFKWAATIDLPSSISNLKFFVGRSRCKQSQRWPRQREQYGNRLKWIEFANYQTASATVRDLSTWPHILRTAWETLLLKLGRQPMHAYITEEA